MRDRQGDTDQDAKTTLRPVRPDDDVYLLGDVEDLKRVLNHLHAGVVAHGADTTVRVCNPMACSILGLTMNQMIGLTAPDPQWRFLREDGSVMPLEEYPVAVVLGTQERLDNLLVGVNRPAHGDLLWAPCNGYPVFDEDGELQLAIISFIDVTELRRAEKERERLETQLRQAMKMEAVGRLAGGIAHDFNNILTGILGYAELVERCVDAETPAAQFTTQIRIGAERAADLTGQLLAFARKQVVEPRVMQVNDVISRSQSMLGRLLGEDVELIVTRSPDLHHIRMDPGQADQIVLNLAVNARDAMPDGGQLRISTANISLHKTSHAMSNDLVSGDFVAISVSDDGEGMPAEVKDRIFEPFFTTKGHGKGTGLGLATVYGIVSQNGGFLRVESAPGRGTTFHVLFPVVHEPIESELPDERVPASAGVGTILLVEDEGLVRELACKILSDHGYTVLVAEDAQAALRLSQDLSQPFDLLLSDVIMPGMNGRELYQQLLINRPSLTALFMSGYTESVIAPHGVLADGTNFIQKPFKVAALLGRVQDLLD